MMENMRAILRKIEILPRTEAELRSKLGSDGEDHLRTASQPLIDHSCTGVSLDGTNLLPTDDQLDQFVDNLCDSFPSLRVKLSDNNLNDHTSTDSSDRESLELVQDQSTSLLIDSTIAAGVLVQSNVSAESVVAPSQKKKARAVPGNKSATPYTNLNMSMIRCLKQLDRLSETRKSLEAHVRWQPHALSSMTRLPQSPTRVDRLMFEVDQERSRVLGLIAALENTVQVFSATTTKDDLRSMLERFRKTIIDVVKERHNEVDALGSGANPDTGNRATQLAQFIDGVTLLIREANTALWCLKQQVLTIKSRKHCLEGTPSQSMITRVSASEPEHEAAQSSPDLEQLAHLSSQQIVALPKIGGSNGSEDGDEGGSQNKSRVGHQRCAVVLGVPRTNLFPPASQSPTFSSKSKKSSAMQLIAQQQRAEIFQRYASALNGARKDAIIK